jgi:hypothetical protein
MKFIAKLSLLIIALSAISISSTNNWCGSGKVNVQIETEEGTTKEITKASMIVPRTMVSISKFVEDNATLELIPKREQGIILYLEGQANAHHLGSIYNYDEDDNRQVFIPYIYIAAVNQNIDSINISMVRTFKEMPEGSSSPTSPRNVIKTFTLRFVNDEYDVALCDCQIEYLLRIISFNFTRRIAIVTKIAENLIKTINFYLSLLKEIQILENKQPDRSKIIEINGLIEISRQTCKKIGEEEYELSLKIQALTIQINAITLKISTLKKDISTPPANFIEYRNDSSKNTLSAIQVSIETMSGTINNMKNDSFMTKFFKTGYFETEQTALKSHKELVEKWMKNTGFANKEELFKTEMRYFSSFMGITLAQKLD